MRINLQNYEEYFVRYLDGELSSQEAGEVELFLQQHPELNTELNAFKSTVLSADEEIFFPGKELLKKGITLVNYEDYFIRKIEDALSSEEEIDLSVFMQQHPELQREMNAFVATKLVADSSVVFPDKNSLKRRNGRVVPMYVRYTLATAIAASLILIVTIRGIHQTDQPVNSPVAEQPSFSSPQTEKGSSKDANEKVKQITPHSELATEHTLNSTQTNSTNKVNHSRSENRGKENSEQFADASVHIESNPSTENTQTISTTNVEDEMTTIGSGLQPISYQARFKKAPYRAVSITAANKNSASPENKSIKKFTSVASALGSELLRLTGREDYLKTTSAFNSQGAEKKKLPLVISVKGKKFDFYHKFFRKRNHSSSEQNPR
ncbi:MAG TPA: hypothetical protein VE978_01275 [Chitinophagales bacterium]|nr:hypothetical protein [Chitinophagales bacterium]